MNAPRRVGRTLCEAFAEEERRKEQVSNEYEDVMGRFDWWLATVRHGRLSRDPDRHDACHRHNDRIACKILLNLILLWRHRCSEDHFY